MNSATTAANPTSTTSSSASAFKRTTSVGEIWREPPSTSPRPHTRRRVICHGDLHPFNLLVDGHRWTLIDWSTAVLADPHYDLAFTTLMLANPPLGGPAPLRAATRAIGTRLANRFLRSYEQQSGRSVDRERLLWGRRAHALRALVEIATWEANDTIDAHRGHPWLTMRPTLERELGRAGYSSLCLSTRWPSCTFRSGR